MIWFLIILAVVIVTAFLIPIRVVIDTRLNGDNVYYVDNTKKNNDITVVIKILGFIPVYKYNNNDKKKKNIKKGNNDNLTVTEILDVLKVSVSKEELKLNELISKIFKWVKGVKFNKLILIGGFNTEDYVKNAYINASINSTICMYINANQDRFNLNKLYYQVSISDYKYYLKLYTVLSFPLINNRDVFKTILNIVHTFRKKKKYKNKQNISNNETNYINNSYINIQNKFDIT